MRKKLKSRDKKRKFRHKFLRSTVFVIFRYQSSLCFLPHPRHVRRQNSLSGFFMKTKALMDLLSFDFGLKKIEIFRHVDVSHIFLGETLHLTLSLWGVVLLLHIVFLILLVPLLKAKKIIVRLDFRLAVFFRRVSKFHRHLPS